MPETWNINYNTIRIIIIFLEKRSSHHLYSHINFSGYITELSTQITHLSLKTHFIED